MTECATYSIKTRRKSFQHSTTHQKETPSAVSNCSIVSVKDNEMPEVRFVVDLVQKQEIRACPSCYSDIDGPALENSILCTACVRSALQRAHERHEAAKNDWVVARRTCAGHFEREQRQQDCGAAGPSGMAELQDRSRALREELERLRQECAEAAVRLCATQLRTEERLQQLHEQAAVSTNRETLHRLNQSICDPKNSRGALVLAIGGARESVRTLRFHWALQAFQMHRLQVEEGYADASRQTERRKGARRNFVSGVGKIGGLPLPHAGPELFGVLPAEELQSALRLVAQLTNLAARCLGILLPHPILLQPPSSENSTPSRLDEGDIASLALDNGGGDSAFSRQPVNTQETSLASSITTALQEQASSLLGESSLAPVRLSMDPGKVQQRVRHAVSAVIAEDQSRNCSTHYALAAENTNRDEFAIALQLLQNNVIALGIRAGVPVMKLWPGEAVLLNLHALKLYCETQVQVETSVEAIFC